MSTKKRHSNPTSTRRDRDLRKVALLCRRVRAFALVAMITVLVEIPTASTWALDLPPLIKLPTCPLCTNFVTTFDPDGGGARPAVTRIHRNIAVNVPYVLDVDGTLPPVPFVADLSVRVVVNGEPLLHLTPGYELKATVTTLTGDRPTVRLAKLQSAPPELPLRVEIVEGDVVDPLVEKSTFGYDTLTSTAPQTFVARLDQSDRDGNPATDQVRVAIDIGGPAGRLTVVNEKFKGDPAGVRTARHVRRAELIGDPARGTQVPSFVSLDLTTSASHQHLVLTRRERTTLEFELVGPGGDPRTTGRIDELPPTADVRITDVDVNGDGRADKRIDYAAGAIVDRAEFAAKNGDRTTKATVEAVPQKVGLTFATKDVAIIGAAPLQRTDVTYHADSRARLAAVEVAGPDKTFSGRLEDLPTRIELAHTPSADGATLAYQSDATLARAEVRTSEVHRSKVDPRDVYTSEFEGVVEGLPSVLDLTYANSANRVSINHKADAPVSHIGVRVSDRIAASGTTAAHRREIAAAVDGLPATAGFTLDSAASTVEYMASARTTSAHVVVSDELPLFERATKLNLTLADIPPRVTATLRADRLEFDAGGERVGEIAVVGTNGAAWALGDNEDGVVIRDFKRPDLDSYVLFGRVRGLRHLLYGPSQSAVRMEFDAVPPDGTDLVVDVKRDVVETVWIERLADNIRKHHSRPGTESITARLADYPAGITLDLTTEREKLRVDYGSSRPAGPMFFDRRTNYRGQPVPVVYKQQYTTDRIPGTYPPSDFDRSLTVTLDPMPQIFHVCSFPRSAECSENTWDSDMFEDFNPGSEANGGSVRIWASERTAFGLDELSTVEMPITYTRMKSEVDAAGDECEAVVSSLGFPVLCRYTDVKPGVATKHIALSLDDLIIQSHLESAGWVGRNISSIFAGDAAKKQGYVAMDTGWRGPPEISGSTLCQALGQLPNCQAGQFTHGHYPPPDDVAIHGIIEKTGSACANSEDCEALHDRFSASRDNPFVTGFGAKIDELTLAYGKPFAADRRVFEFDPDELILAKHKSGHVYCGAGTSLKAGASAFNSDFCEISLPAEGQP